MQSRFSMALHTPALSSFPISVSNDVRSYVAAAWRALSRINDISNKARLLTLRFHRTLLLLLRSYVATSCPSCVRTCGRCLSDGVIMRRHVDAGIRSHVAPQWWLSKALRMQALRTCDFRRD
jgi:hypothetical protein